MYHLNVVWGFQPAYTPIPLITSPLWTVHGHSTRARLGQTRPITDFFVLLQRNNSRTRLVYIDSFIYSWSTVWDCSDHMPVSARTTIKGSRDPYLQTLHYRIELKRHLVRKHSDIKTLACCLETTVLPGFLGKVQQWVVSITYFHADFLDNSASVKEKTCILCSHRLVSTHLFISCLVKRRKKKATLRLFFSFCISLYSNKPPHLRHVAQIF